MDILLHICCGPCLIFPLGRLKSAGHNVYGFYYNPNIYPEDEYLRRKGALDLLNQDFKLQIKYPEYLQEEFSKAIGDAKDKPLRCQLCWQLRLKNTASQAKARGIKVFSTTLLVSPYQDHQAIKKIGQQVACEYDLEFYYQDWRIGFKEAQDEARKRGIYRQKYCGCQYSIKNEKKS